MFQAVDCPGCCAGKAVNQLFQVVVILNVDHGKAVNWLFRSLVPGFIISVSQLIRLLIVQYVDQVKQ